MKTELNSKETQLLSVALPILQGLLASGLYTKLYDDGPGVTKRDNGADWKTQDITPIFHCRYSTDAVRDALDTAYELVGQIKIEAAEPDLNP